MEYTDMLDEMREVGFTIIIRSLGASWQMCILENEAVNYIIMVDGSLESLIGRAYSAHYLKKGK